MRRLAWEQNGWADYIYWQNQDKKTLKRINKLIEDVLRDSLKGIGKPEPLKENLAGARIEDSPVVEDDDLRVRAASRRIDEANRLVYKVKERYIIVVSCRYYY